MQVHALDCPNFAQTSICKRMLECINEAVIIINSENKITYANKVFCDLIEFPLKEIIGQDSTFFYNESSRNKVNKIINTHRRNKIPMRYEGTLITKSGKEIHGLFNDSPFENSGTISEVHDMTTIKEKETMYKTLIETMNEAVWVGDKNERTIFVNPKFTKLVGYSMSEMLGKESYVFWDKESAERVRLINKIDRVKGKSSSYEGNLLTKKGEKIPVLISGAALENGTVGIITDISDIKHKEQKEKILNTAIQYSTDAIIIFDKEGKIESWNAGAKIIFGYKKEEMIGKNISKLFTKKNAQKLFQNYQILYNFELNARQKSDNIIKISATLTQIPHESDIKSAYYLLIARDITHQMRIEEELTLKYQKIKEAYNQYGIVRRQMDYLFELLEIANETPDKKSIADFIVSSVIMLTRVEACVLRVYNNKKNTLDLISSFGVDEDWQGKRSIKYIDSLAAKAFKQNMPLRIIDINEEAKYQSSYLARKHHFSSMLLIPLTFNGQLVGSMSMYVTPDKKLEIFENEFIEKYAQLIQLVIGTMYMCVKPACED